MENDHEKVVKVTDKRGRSDGSASALTNETPPSSARFDEVDLVGDLQRVQAEFENYRKRVMRDQASVADRAVARVVEHLLPVLDNFERAIGHGEGGEGVALVLKEFTAALEREGVSEVPADGAEFDPMFHEAVEARDVDGLEVPTVIEVRRRGYMLKDQLLRAAMVVVGRPRESQESSDV